MCERYFATIAFCAATVLSSGTDASNTNPYA